MLLRLRSAPLAAIVATLFVLVIAGLAAANTILVHPTIVNKVPTLTSLDHDHDLDHHHDHDRRLRRHQRQRHRRQLRAERRRRSDQGSRRAGCGRYEP